MRTPLLMTIPFMALFAACAGEDTKEPEPGSVFDIGQFEDDEGRACVPLVSIDSTKILGDRAIEFRMRGGKSYINILPQRCIGLRPHRILSWETSQSELCNLDIIRILDQIGGGLQRVGACGLGKFHELPEGGVGGDDEG